MLHSLERTVAIIFQASIEFRIVSFAREKEESDLADWR